jgi:hypothetical protein
MRRWVRRTGTDKWDQSRRQATGEAAEIVTQPRVWVRDYA